MKENTYIKVGKIVNTFGIKGELKVYSYTDFPKERFIKGKRLFLGPEASPNQLPIEVESAKPYKNMYLLKLKGKENINEVEKYKNMFLWIPKSEQGDLEEGEYYYHQIIGCKVITTDGTELGIINDILSPGANDVWVVKPFNKGKDILIPYIKSVVLDVDTSNKIITINVIEGLLE